jgi:hypothetical protein
MHLLDNSCKAHFILIFALDIILNENTDGLIIDRRLRCPNPHCTRTLPSPTSFIRHLLACKYFNSRFWCYKCDRIEEVSTDDGMVSSSSLDQQAFDHHRLSVIEPRMTGQDAANIGSNHPGDVLPSHSLDTVTQSSFICATSQSGGGDVFNVYNTTTRTGLPANFTLAFTDDRQPFVESTSQDKDKSNPVSKHESPGCVQIPISRFTPELRHSGEQTNGNNSNCFDTEGPNAMSNLGRCCTRLAHHPLQRDTAICSSMGESTFPSFASSTIPSSVATSLASENAAWTRTTWRLDFQGLPDNDRQGRDIITTDSPINIRTPPANDSHTLYKLEHGGNFGSAIHTTATADPSTSIKSKSNTIIMNDEVSEQYKCPDCSYRPTGKEGNFGTYFQRHSLVHQGRRYRCELGDCQRSYTRKDNLQNHQKKDHHVSRSQKRRTSPSGQDWRLNKTRSKQPRSGNLRQD